MVLQQLLRGCGSDRLVALLLFLCCLQRDSGKKRDERKLGSNGALARSLKTHTPAAALGLLCVQLSKVVPK
jgi:hypothetical protein